ncbi:MAG: hypothetical protein BGO99_05605 [Nitrosospira sp. 56-18]|nr:MAG: hypothetical protein BGO99_05605 [Nitrosospira sp. 56-18]
MPAFASPPFAHPIPQSHRRASRDLFSASLTIYLAAIAYFHHKDAKRVILDFGNYPVITNPVLPEFTQM